MPISQALANMLNSLKTNMHDDAKFNIIFNDISSSPSISTRMSNAIAEGHLAQIVYDSTMTSNSAVFDSSRNGGPAIVFGSGALLVTPQNSLLNIIFTIAHETAHSETAITVLNPAVNQNYTAFQNYLSSHPGSETNPVNINYYVDQYEDIGLEEEARAQLKAVNDVGGDIITTNKAADPNLTSLRDIDRKIIAQNSYIASLVIDPSTGAGRGGLQLNSQGLFDLNDQNIQAEKAYISAANINEPSTYAMYGITQACKNSSGYISINAASLNLDSPNISFVESLSRAFLNDHSLSVGSNGFCSITDSLSGITVRLSYTGSQPDIAVAYNGNFNPNPTAPTTDGSGFTNFIVGQGDNNWYGSYSSATGKYKSFETNSNGSVLNITGVGISEPRNPLSIGLDNNLGVSSDGTVTGEFGGNPVKLSIDPLASSQQVQPTETEIAFSEVSKIFGSTLGRLIGGSNLIIGTAAGSVISSVALTVGQRLFGLNFFYTSDGRGIARSEIGAQSVWSDFTNSLTQFGTNAAIGSASSYLAAEFEQAIGFQGFGGQLFSSVSGNVLQYAATNLANGQPVTHLFSNVNGTSLGSSLTSGIASFIGTELAQLVVTPHTVAEATLASLGTAIGAYEGALFGGAAATGYALTGSKIGAAVAGPIGVVVGAFIGFILGDLIGSLFGSHKPRIPTASAETVLQIPYAQYALGTETSANGGDLQLADAMAKAARDTLNGLIAQITQGAKPVFVSNTYSPTQAYGISGSQIYVKLGGAQTNVTSANQAVDKGVLWALPQTKIIGGDLILKRAVQNGVWSTVTEMLGDLQIAADYETYLKSKPVIDAAIGSSWNSLSAADQTFYTANKAFMTRAISASQLPLTGGDVTFYNANKTQVDRIVGSISVSSFAAGWIVTLARAAELKLDQFGPSDFFGGLQGFLQSFNVNSTGTAVHYEDVSARMVNNGLKVSAGGAAAAGTFSLLPQSSATGDAVTISNFASVMGYAIRDAAAGPAGGNDVITAAMPIPLANASFEEPGHEVNVATGTPPGWTMVGDEGTWHPGTQITPTDGLNVAYLSPQEGYNKLSQQAGTFVAGRTYSFSVDVGVRNDVQTYGWANLLISSDVGVRASTLSPAFYPWGGMHTATVVYTATAADAGHPISVTIEGGGTSQVNVDNARLNSAIATVIPLANPSFENPWHPDGGYSGQIPDWISVGDNGTFNATGQIAVTEGDNNAYLNPQVGYSKIYQQAGTFETGKTYTFSIDVGVRNDIGSGADVSLFISNASSIRASGGAILTAAPGTMQRLSVSYTATAADNGQPLFVTVEPHSGSQVNVDNASLIATPGVTVAAGSDAIYYPEIGLNNPATNTGDDIIIGGDGADSLNAGVGNDWIEGGSGNDTIIGGTGRDVLLGGSGNDSISGGTGDTYLAGGTGDDLLVGGSGNDVLVGGDGADTIHAGDGNDTIIVDPDGGAVWDYLDGGNGNDTASYERFTAGIALDMWNGQGNGYTSQFYGDGLVSIENITGTNFDDVIYGNDSGNVLMGLAGNDIIAARPGDDILEGGAGADYLNGDAGVNTTSYEHSSAGVYVNLWTGTAIGGDATGDVFYNIQNIIGSAFGDELQGSLYTNSIKAGAGDDWIDGTRSNPGLVIDGGDGFDTMDYSQDNFQEGAGSPLAGDPNAAYYGGIIPALSVAVTSSGTVAYYRDGDGYQSSQTLVSVEQVIGTQRNDLFTNTTNIGMTWDGKGGNDIYYGGTGSDTYVFGRGYGTDSIHDDKSASNTVKFDSSVTFDDLLVFNDASAGLHFIIRGTSDELVVNNDWNPQIGNDVVKTLDLAGAAHVDLTQICATVIGNDSANTLGGSASYSLISWGYGGNDTISPANGNYSTLGSIVAGGLGDDIINTSIGDDQFLFERGDGHDVINDGGGQNTIIFGPTVGASDVIYKVVGNDLYIGIKDLSNAALDASQVADNIKVVGGGVQYVDQISGATTFNTVFSVEAGGSTTALAHANIAWTTQPYWNGGYYYPVVLDLNGDGLEVTPVAQSDIVTKDTSGNVLRTSWVGPTNGILAFDRNGDGKISNTDDISFVQDKPGAKTDLEGLAGWDSNGDGILDAKDANFSKLVVWTDRNVDGRAEKGEVKSLAQLGIQSIALTPKPTGFNGSDSIDTIVRNTTTFTRTDGTTGTGYDVAFARQLLTGPVATDEAKSIDTKAVGEFGRLENDPLALVADPRAVAALKKAGGKASTLAPVSALADVNQSDADKNISAASAARWADYLDPVKISARKNLEATRTSGAQNIDAIRNSTAYPGGVNPYLKQTAQAGPTNPHVLVVDFNHDGPSLIAPAASKAVIDSAGSGQKAQVGWVDPSDGILAYDGNGDGRVDPKSEISFDQISAGGQTGLAALKAYDTNGDGVLSSADSSFARFLIWRDANGDGASKPKELVTLDQAGVSSINLATTVLHLSGSSDGSVNNVVGIGEIDFTDGSSRALYDVALGNAASTNQTSTQPSSAAGNTASLLQAATAAGQGAAASSSSNPASSATPPQDTAGLAGVGRARGSLAGPDGVVVQSASAGQDDTQWWRDAGIVGTTLANLASPLSTLGTTLATSASSGTGTSTTDAATLQRLMLLRQNMAGQGGSSGGDAAVWARGTTTDISTALTANSASGLTTIPKPSLAA